MGEKRCGGESFQALVRRCGQRIREDRQYDGARPSAPRRGASKKGADQALGRSRGGLSSKMHASVEARGHPTSCALTPGQAHDWEGADLLLSEIQSDTVIADKAYDADERVLRPWERAGKTFVLPLRGNRKNPRRYDRELYKARHRIENFFARRKQFRAIATRYDKTARNFLAAIYLAASLIWLN
ncbi:MAG: IS5 family transposase [Candidatus Dormibacteria bacterium]